MEERLSNRGLRLAPTAPSLPGHGLVGRELPKEQQKGRTPFAPRCVKDRVEEALFAHRRDLFSDLQLVFFDTTSIYFEGAGGESLGQRGYSKDHRPDLKQMIVGTVLDGQGRPICCELWPGNTTDVKTLIPVVDRLRSRFAISRVCIVADRGMISKETLDELEKKERGWLYILGARMRTQSEVRDEVISRAGRYRVVHSKSDDSEAPSPLDVKEVWVEGHRYVVCRNPDEARKDAADREAIVAALKKQLRSGANSLVGNRGYRRYLSGRARTLPDRRGQDRRRRPLRRQVGSAYQHRVGYSRSGAAVQAAMDGRTMVPLVQVADPYPPDLPPG